MTACRERKNHVFSVPHIPGFSATDLIVLHFGTPDAPKASLPGPCPGCGQLHWPFVAPNPEPEPETSQAGQAIPPSGFMADSLHAEAERTERENHERAIPRNIRSNRLQRLHQQLFEDGAPKFAGSDLNTLEEIYTDAASILARNLPDNESAHVAIVRLRESFMMARIAYQHPAAPRG